MDDSSLGMNAGFGESTPVTYSFRNYAGLALMLAALSAVS
jgi:hypothetical protein